MKKLTLLSIVILAAASGCQQDTSTKKTGSYTATRHSQTGSNIPKPLSADSASQTYDPDQFANAQNQQSALNNRAMQGGGGR